MVLLIFGQLFLVGAVLQEKLPLRSESPIPPAEVTMKAPEGKADIAPSARIASRTETPAAEPRRSPGLNPFRKPLPVTILGITRQDEKP
ncbi:MAG TPA: hypothetical protein PKO06_05490, partial [Candidatus Ozemobacteraceae bacterium]|nr:hypothetical protein [Candidatus Ozemobacteraceae bacterium]